MAIISSSSSSSFILIVFDNDQAVLSPFPALFQAPWFGHGVERQERAIRLSKKVK
jgi:hypothetical protein